jgi:hypothetical protein
MEPRGVRNNNFGNIEDGPFARSLPGYTGTDGRFATFSTPDDGLDAINRLLLNYGRKGANNINSIVNRWAPSSDGNNVSAYASSVAQNTGFDPNAPLDMTNPAVRSALARAIAIHENGPGVKSKLPGGDGMTPNARVQDGFMGLPMSPNERVADSFDALSGGTDKLPPNATPTAGSAPLALAQAAAATKQPGADPEWVGSTGNALLNTGAILQSLGSIDGKSVMPQLAQNALAIQAANKPQWGVIGEDALGGKQYGWIDPNKRSVSAYNGSADAGGSGGADGNKVTIDAINAIKQGDDSSIPELIRETVKKVAAYDMDPRTLIGRGGQYRNAVMAAVSKYAPDFDEGQYSTRKAAMKEFNAGGPNAPASMITSGRTAIGHADKLLALSEKVGGPDDMGMANGAANGLNALKLSMNQNPDGKAYNALLSKFVEEGTRFYRGTGGNEADLQRDLANLSLANSKDARAAALQTLVGALQSKIAAYDGRWHTAMGDTGWRKAIGEGVPDFPVLDRTAKEAYDRVIRGPERLQQKQQDSTANSGAKRRPLSDF